MDNINGTFTIEKVKQRIELVCKFLEYYLTENKTVTISLNCRVMRLDAKKMQKIFKKKIFPFHWNLKLDLDLDSYHAAKIILYKYFPYTCRILIESEQHAEFPVKNNPPRVRYKDSRDKKKITAVLNNLEHYKIIESYSDSAAAVFSS